MASKPEPALRAVERRADDDERASGTNRHGKQAARAAPVGHAQAATPDDVKRGTAAGALRGHASFTVPPRPSAADLGTAVRAIVGSASPPGPAGVVVGKPVPTAGQFSGHCAFVALLRSSGAALPPGDELAAVAALRRIAVAHLCGRLLSEPDLPHALAATLGDAAEDGGMRSGRRGRGAAAGRGSSSSSSATVTEPPSPWPALTAYLLGQLSPRATAASQYAGALELAGIAARLARRVVVLVESDNTSDVGGAYPAVEPLFEQPRFAGFTGTLQSSAAASSSYGRGTSMSTSSSLSSSSEAATAASSHEHSAPALAGALDSSPPLVIVNTRRQHMYPVLVAPGTAAARPLGLAGLQAAVTSVMAEVAAAVTAATAATAASASSACVVGEHAHRSEELELVSSLSRVLAALQPAAAAHALAPAAKRR